MPPAPGALAWLSVAVVLGAYALIATERIHRVAAALGGAGIMLLIHASNAEAAFFSKESGVDWNVIFLLLGMMVIVGVLKQTGVFEHLAIWAAKRARGRPYRLMVLLVVITAAASALLDNVTTVLLIAPVTFLVCDRLALPVVPYLIAQAMASNIGGAAATRIRTTPAAAACIDQPDRASTAPSSRPPAAVPAASTRAQAAARVNLAATMAEREAGRASKSLAVWSLNSRPNSQMAIML